MLIQSRLGGVGAQWRQLSKVGRIAVLSASIFFILAFLWSIGTVDVDYVRNQFKNIAENYGNEPIPDQKNETPIIDGVPNDLNDRPIPNGVIEGAVDNKPTENKGASGKQDAAPSSNTKPVKVDSEKTHEQDTPSSAVTTEPAETKLKPIAGGVPLRIMFIGASMTLGTPPQSAYRMELRKWLVSLGNAVNCVGTNRFGKFKDNDVQAYPATPIQILHEKAQEAVPEMQPNLVVINAGSSDCFQEKHWGSAHAFDYTRALVDFVFEASPRATVVLSTLVTSPNPAYERCIKSVNAQIRQVAADLIREGKPLVLSEQHVDQGLPGRVTASDISRDQMHPTFDGWALMTEIFKRDILEADANGWIVAPVENGIMDDGDAERDLEEAEKASKGGEEGEKKPQGQKASDEKKKKTTTTTTDSRRLRRSRMW
ncbi:hypothetical protein F5Y14DRAFT_363404 [Nemania sp. NC0429]|nr:hypothetical protein F5Y14DRAFT_363404 [Nemania sp. NC0429]